MLDYCGLKQTYQRVIDMSVAIILRVVAAVVVSGCVSACSYAYMDDAGVRHVVGFVDIAVSRPKNNPSLAGDVLDVTTVGLALSRNAQGGHLALGYSREVTAELLDNVLVIGNPLLLGAPSGKYENCTSDGSITNKGAK